MSIATEKIKQSSERFFLVRMEPARYIEPTSIGGGVYSMTFSYPVSKVQRNGLSLSLVTTLTANDQYTFNEDTGLLQMKLAAAPDVDSNVIVAFYYLFFTGDRARVAPQTPTSSSTTSRQWAPRILTYPEFSQSFNNIQHGVFTIADSSIRFANPDSHFQQYMTDNDSFYNKEVSVWICINSVDNISRSFSGYVTGVSWDSQSITFDVSDSFSRLKNTAFMGDSEDECVLSTQDIATLHPAANGKAVPYIFGKFSYHKFSAFASSRYYMASGTPAYCTNYSTDKQVTTNRTWILARAGAVIPTQSFGSFVSATTHGAAYTEVEFSSLSNVFVGDTLTWTTAGTPYYALIIYVTGNTVWYRSPVTAITGASTMTANPAMGLLVRNTITNDLTFPRYGRDYTLTTTTTTGSNKLFKITFSNDFENDQDSVSGNPWDTLDPDSMAVEFKIQATRLSAKDTLVLLLQKVGFTAPGANFDDFDDSVFDYPRFHIPNIDEQEYDTYLKYVEDFLGGCLGYIYTSSFNTVAGAAIHPADYPLDVDTVTRDRNLILADSVSGRFDYQDIATQLVPYNPHMDDSPLSAVNDSIKNNKAVYLHDIKNTNRLKHPFESLSSRINTHIELKSNRFGKYRYETATEDITSRLGTRVTVKNKIVAGDGSQERMMQIISLDRSPAKIVVEATDLAGVTTV
jgi:hypothetical protein